MLLLSLFLLLWIQVLAIVDEEVAKFDLSDMLFHALLFFACFVSLLVLLAFCLSDAIINFSFFDFSLPLDEIEIVLLFPVSLPFVSIVFPNFIDFLFQLLDLLVDLVLSFLLSFLPLIVLFIASLLSFGFFCLFSANNLNKSNNYALKLIDSCIFLVDLFANLLALLFNGVFLYLQSCDLFIKLFFSVFSTCQFNFDILGWFSIFQRSLLEHDIVVQLLFLLFGQVSSHQLRLEFV